MDTETTTIIMEDQEVASSETDSKSNTRIIVTIYPFVILVIGVMVVHVLSIIFGIDINAFEVQLPSEAMLRDVVISAVLLTINHSWIMTSTELTRLKYGLCATSEECEKQGKDPDHASKEGLREVKRRHNIHRNTTELKYDLLRVIGHCFCVCITLKNCISCLDFIVSNCPTGYTTAYILKNTDVRGFCMTLSLLSMYGMA
eukprot:317694_1